MELISQKDQARLLTQDVKYVSSKKCQKCGLPTGLGVLKCIHCLQAAYLEEELVYTRDWLLGHLDEPLVVGHDKHGLMHLALLRTPLLNVGWCGEKVSQKREKRRLVSRTAFPATVLERICVPCEKAFEAMGLV
jgi:hypothetical protein